MIRRLELKNFKRFSNHTFEFLPDGLTLIAGGNNSGKSSILHALALWEYCRRAIETKHGRGALEAGGGGHVFRTPFKDFTPLMVPDFQHLWTNLTTAANGGPAPLLLKATWLDRAASNAERELEFTLDLPGPLRVKPTMSTVPPGGPIPRMAYLPPFAGIKVKEPKLDVPARERLLGQGLPGAILRNHLIDLVLKSRATRAALSDLRGRLRGVDRTHFLTTDAWTQLVSVLNEEFKCMVYPAESRARADGHIDLTANFTKGNFVNKRFTKHPRYKARDLVAEGSGFLQWLSVFALAVDPEIDVLLLDEADVHLHPTLQAQLLFRLKREAVDKGKQVLFVTHSTEILRGADYRTVFHLSERSRGYLGEESGKVGVIEGLGSIYMPRIENLRRFHRLLFIEGSSDIALLKVWAATLGMAWPEKLVDWSFPGKPSERKTLFLQLNGEVEGLQALSLRDRDEDPFNTTTIDLRDTNYPDAPVRAGQNHKILHRKWRRRHVENYLLLPSAITRAAVAKGRTCTEASVIDFLREKHSAIVNETFVQSECHLAIADLHAKEITYSSSPNIEDIFGVDRFEIARAMTPPEICDDVKSLLGQIRDLCL